MSRKKKHTGPSGVLPVDKPPGITSFDVIRRLRPLLKTRQVGHCGTLDPGASGVLVLCVGWATRLVPYLTAEDKEYTGEVVLGITTRSDDADGEVVERRDVEPPAAPSLRKLEQQFIGELMQTPPQVSAIRVDGKRAHERVRSGEHVEVPPRRVTVHELELGTSAEPSVLKLRALVSKGTYIRSLARDIGAELGCGAHLRNLRRTRSGALRVGQCLTLEQIGEKLSAGESVLTSSWEALATWPVLDLSSEERQHLVHGQRPHVSTTRCATDGIYRVRDEDGDLFGLIAGKRNQDHTELCVERLRPMDNT